MANILWHSHLPMQLIWRRQNLLHDTIQIQQYNQASLSYLVHAQALCQSFRTSQVNAKPGAALAGVGLYGPTISKKFGLDWLMPPQGNVPSAGRSCA